MLKNYKNIIFDLDGTIINSSQEILNCLKKSYSKANYYVDNSKFTSDVIGPPIKTIITTVSPELSDKDKINEVISNFRRIYDNDENDISVMYDGVDEFLKNLKDCNKRLFIATFKPKIPTLRILNKLGIIDLFDEIYTVDKFDVPMSKSEMIRVIVEQYELDRTKTLMIGDAVSDMIAAKENNIGAIGALWGYGNDKSKLIQSADTTIKDIKEVICQKLNYQTI